MECMTQCRNNIMNQKHYHLVNKIHQYDEKKTFGQSEINLI